MRIKLPFRGYETYARQLLINHQQRIFFRVHWHAIRSRTAWAIINFFWNLNNRFLAPKNDCNVAQLRGKKIIKEKHQPFFLKNSRVFEIFEHARKTVRKNANHVYIRRQKQAAEAGPLPCSARNWTRKIIEPNPKKVESTSQTCATFANYSCIQDGRKDGRKIDKTVMSDFRGFRG